MRLVLTAGQATPEGDNVCSQRAKETFFRSSQMAQQNQTEDLH